MNYVLLCVCMQAWLDDHERAFGHFIDGKWVKPEGRKTYQTKNPATGWAYSMVYRFNYHVGTFVGSSLNHIFCKDVYRHFQLINCLP